MDRALHGRPHRLINWWNQPNNVCPTRSPPIILSLEWNSFLATTTWSIIHEMLLACTHSCPSTDLFLGACQRRNAPSRIHAYGTHAVCLSFLWGPCAARFLCVWAHVHFHGYLARAGQVKDQKLAVLKWEHVLMEIDEDARSLAITLGGPCVDDGQHSYSNVT